LRERARVRGGQEKFLAISILFLLLINLGDFLSGEIGELWIQTNPVLGPNLLAALRPHGTLEAHCKII
jgi:hypothetical protein